MPHFKYFAAAPAMFAALSLTATPAAAADMSLPAPIFSDVMQAHDIEASQAAHHHRYHRYRHRRGPSLGDVVAGVLIVGAIAHAADRASDRDRRYRDRDDRRDARWDEGRGLDRAVGMCIDAVERRAQVETVDRADRMARGWRIEGTVRRGGGFTCDIDSDGRGVRVDLGREDSRHDREDREDRDYREDREDREDRDDRERDYRERDDDDDGDGRYDDIDYREDRSERDDRRGDEGRDDNDQWADDRYASEWSKVDRGAPVETAQAEEAPYPAGEAEEDDAEIDGDLEIGTGYKGAGA